MTNAGWVDLTATEIKILRRYATNDRQFAELIQAKIKEKNGTNIEKLVNRAYAKGAAEEREECAKRLDAIGCDHCATNIRARGQL